MKTEPQIGDFVWIYIFDKLWKCEVKERVPTWSDSDSDLGLTYRIRLIGGTTPGGADGLLLQRKYFFPTAREAINEEIKHKNDLIREHKKVLDAARADIKELKQKRADLQRLLEHYH